MEIITVCGPAPDDTLSPEYLKWHEREFGARGALVLNQSAQIQALQGQIAFLEKNLASIVETCRGLVKRPEPPGPLELVEDPYGGELPEPDEGPAPDGSGLDETVPVPEPTADESP